MSRIQSLYIQEYIKKIIDIRYAHLPPPERLQKLQIQLKLIINNIRHITTTTEIDKYNSPMGFLFQHLKPDIVSIIGNCSAPNDKLYIDRHLTTTLEWNIRLFNTMKILNAKDLMIWYFLHVPYYFHNPTFEIPKYRIIYESMLDYLIDYWPSDHYLSEREFLFISNESCMPYALSYQNCNNATILAKYSQLIRKICPWVNYYSGRLANRLFSRNNQSQCQQLQSQQTARNKPSQNKIKICFISDSFQTDSSVFRDRVSIIGKLDKSRYDVYFASFYPITAIQGKISQIFFKTLAEQGRYLYLREKSVIDPLKITPLESARAILDNLDFDYIVYPDLGMKLLTTLLAYSRIAKIQITTWGHSETSGIDTIDYFISSQWFENTNSTPDNKYTEKLILFKSLGTYYISPTKLFINQSSNQSSSNHSGKFKSKEELGFQNTDNIYCCLQTFYKITPEFEHVMVRILEMDPHGVILLSNSFPYCQSHLSRIRDTIGENKLQRVKWYPSIDKLDFLNLVSVSDVVLDPFPFGGCNTSYDAFDYNIPVITYPGQFLHGRFTLGLYQYMGLSDCECIVSSPDEYAQIAVKIALNPKLKHKINRNIEMNKGKIFQDDSSVVEWNELFQKLSEG